VRFPRVSVLAFAADMMRVRWCFADRFLADVLGDLVGRIAEDKYHDDILNHEIPS